MIIELELFNTHLLAALLKAGHRYFVRQTLPREYNLLDSNLKASFLITEYIDMREANIHLENIAGDSNKYVYDTSNEEDQWKLYRAALQPDGYKIYTPLKLENTDVTLRHKNKFKQYIENRLGWQPKKSDDVRAFLSYAFGIFYITFKWNSITAKVTADEVDAISSL